MFLELPMERSRGDSDAAPVAKRLALSHCVDKSRILAYQERDRGVSYK